MLTANHSADIPFIDESGGQTPVFACYRCRELNSIWGGEWVGWTGGPYISHNPSLDPWEEEGSY